MVALLQPRVLPDRGVALAVGFGGLHDLLLSLHVAADGVQAAGGQHAIAGGLLDVAFAGVLRQVAEYVTVFCAHIADTRSVK